jgi:Putative MetA-pathway of phenol degradation
MATRLPASAISTFAGVSAMALFVAWLSACAAVPAFAGQDDPGSQSAATPQQGGSAAESPDYNGLDYTRPQQAAELRLQFRTSSSPTSDTDKEQLFLKVSTKIDLPAAWKLALQGQLQFADKEVTALAPPSTTRDAGLGDSVLQVALIQSIDPHWAYGFGARLVAPSAEDSLGSGEWQIMPGFGVRYSFLEIGPDTYFVPVLRWAVSFAGDPTRRNINEPQLAPTFNIGLPERWFVTLYPSNDIRINYGDPVAGQTGRLFLPFDAALGRDITERITAYLEVSVPVIKDYPVYNFKTEFRLSVKF